MLDDVTSGVTDAYFVGFYCTMLLKSMVYSSVHWSVMLVQCIEITVCVVKLFLPM